MRRSGAEDHWLGEAPLLLQPIIRLLRQLRHGMRRKEFRGDSATVRLVCDGLGAVLTKVEMRPLAIWVRPGTAGAVETVFLIQLQQRQRSADDPGFAPSIVKAGNDSVDSSRFVFRLALAETNQAIRCFRGYVA